MSTSSQCFPNNANQSPFVGQAQQSRRPVPMPGSNPTHSARNMSASVFNLNQSGYPQPGFQPNPWGMNAMNQVSDDFEVSKLALIPFAQAQSMAHLNMMGNQWNMNSQAWPANNFNGSNMSLNMMPSQGFMPNDPAWNPWMQRQPYPYPMMPGGKRTPFTESRKLNSYFHSPPTAISQSLTCSFACLERPLETIHDEFEKSSEVRSRRFD